MDARPASKRPATARSLKMTRGPRKDRCGWPLRGRTGGRVAKPMTSQSSLILAPFRSGLGLLPRSAPSSAMKGNPRFCLNS